MNEVHVVARFAAPLARVFEAVSDHERFIHDALTRTTLVRPGQPDRNGLGALREVRAPLLRFVEEVTAWDPPRSYGYHVRASTLPIRHHGGVLELREVDGEVEVDWRTRFETPVPVLGALLGPVLGFALRRAFLGLLAGAKRRLARDQVAV